MDLKINEKAAIAQKQFMDKCAKLVEGVKGEWQLEVVPSARAQSANRFSLGMVL